MTTVTATHRVTLNVYECPSCGISYGIPADYDNARRVEGGAFYCPNGHSLSYGKSENAKLKAQLAAAQDQRDMANQRARRAREDAEYAQRSAAAYKGHLTRTRKRVAAGVCPCCNRTFQNLGRHMAGQHPDFASDES